MEKFLEQYNEYVRKEKVRDIVKDNMYKYDNTGNKVGYNSLLSLVDIVNETISEMEEN